MFSKAKNFVWKKFHTLRVHLEMSSLQFHICRGVDFLHWRRRSHCIVVAGIFTTSLFKFAMAMLGHAMDRGGLMDSINALNSFFPKSNRTWFWHFDAEMSYEGYLISKSTIEMWRKKACFGNWVLMACCPSVVLLQPPFFAFLEQKGHTTHEKVF